LDSPSHWTSGRRFEPWGDRGDLLGFFTINNPLGLPESAYQTARKRMRVVPEYDRPLLVRFDAAGRMRGYIILKGISSTASVYPQIESVYVASYEDSIDEPWLTRWVVARKP
jgi:hypothetical protein